MITKIYELFGRLMIDYATMRGLIKHVKRWNTSIL